MLSAEVNGGIDVTNNLNLYVGVSEFGHDLFFVPVLVGVVDINEVRLVVVRNPRAVGFLVDLGLAGDSEPVVQLRQPQFNHDYYCNNYPTKHPQPISNIPEISDPSPTPK